MSKKTKKVNKEVSDNRKAEAKAERKEDNKALKQNTNTPDTSQELIQSVGEPTDKQKAQTLDITEQEVANQETNDGKSLEQAKVDRLEEVREDLEKKDLTPGKRRATDADTDEPAADTSDATLEVAKAEEANEARAVLEEEENDALLSVEETAIATTTQSVDPLETAENQVAPEDKTVERGDVVLGDEGEALFYWQKPSTPAPEVRTKPRLRIATKKRDRVKEYEADANPALLTFPTDRFGITKDVKLAITRAASRIGGDEKKLDLFKKTLRILIEHLQLKFENDKQYRSDLAEKRAAEKTVRLAEQNGDAVLDEDNESKD